MKTEDGVKGSPWNRRGEQCRLQSASSSARSSENSAEVCFDFFPGSAGVGASRDDGFLRGRRAAIRGSDSFSASPERFHELLGKAALFLRSRSLEIGFSVFLQFQKYISLCI